MKNISKKYLIEQSYYTAQKAGYYFLQLARFAAEISNFEHGFRLGGLRVILKLVGVKKKKKEYFGGSKLQDSRSRDDLNSSFTRIFFQNKIGFFYICSNNVATCCHTGVVIFHLTWELQTFNLTGKLELFTFQSIPEGRKTLLFLSQKKIPPTHNNNIRTILTNYY